jgi:polyisoprenoid-binding protein YceI
VRAAASLIAPSFFAALTLAAPAASGMNYRIDPASSDARFGVRLLWLQTITGRFSRMTGDITLDDRGFASIDARIDTGTIAMRSDRLRRWVMAPEFFDAARYPTIHFLSQPIDFGMLTRGGALEGQLTLRGVTRPVRFELQPTDCRPSQTQACRIEARGSLSRGAFGMNAHSTALSDQVQLDLQIALEHTSN